MKSIKFENGIQELEIENLTDFFSFINDYLKYRNFVWRGQGDSSWNLEPTLDRELGKINKLDDTKTINEHLKRFKYAVRGRRGLNPKTLENDNDWWALGQHQGLFTPLLDWSKSPFIALFFAFASAEKSTTGKRAIFGISQTAIEWKSNAIKKNHKGNTRASIIEFIEPLSDDNSRLVNQGGLFSRSPSGKHIEDWLIENYDETVKGVKMWKVIIPEDQRKNILQYLNRMNVNYLTLFPDLFGASKFVNIDLEIEDY
jgi:hypothetical protein